MPNKPFGPRSIANKVWFASVSPFAIGLVAFSFVLVAFGSTVYIATVPAMIANDIAAEEGVNNDAQNGGNHSNATGDEVAADDTETSDAQSSDEAGSSTGTSVNSLASSYSGGESSLGSGAAAVIRQGLSVPVLNFTAPPDEGDPSQGEQTPPEENDPSQGGQTPPEGNDPSQGGEKPPEENTDPPTEPTVPDQPKEPTEEEKQELAIHDALVGAYNELPTLYDQVAASFVTFYENHTITERSVKKSYMDSANALIGSIDTAYNNHLYVQGMGALNVPATSAWYSSWNEINALYDDLKLAENNVKTAWQQNWMNRPYSAYIKPIENNAIDGQNKYLLDFVSRYPGVNL